MLILILVKSRRSGGHYHVLVATEQTSKTPSLVEAEVLLRDKHKISISEEVVDVKRIRRVPSAVAFQLAKNREMSSAARNIAKAAFTMGQKHRPNSPAAS